MAELGWAVHRPGLGELVDLERHWREAEELAEPEEAPQLAVECAACGGHKGVRRDLRTGMLSLCTDCAAVMPATDPPRGN